MAAMATSDSRRPLWDELSFSQKRTLCKLLNAWVGDDWDGNNYQLSRVAPGYIRAELFLQDSKSTVAYQVSSRGRATLVEDPA